jgi:hypothetical protein
MSTLGDFRTRFELALNESISLNEAKNAKVSSESMQGEVDNCRL